MAFWTSLITLAAAASASHIAAARAPEPPKLDGHLDDAVWRLAPASDAFTQKVPHDGKPPSERTVVRVLYDDHAVYVGVDCIQTGADVTARLTRRDRQVEADSVSIAFDSRGDKRTSFEFVVNAAGVLADRLHFNDTETSDEWDEIWEARVARTKVGWSAEFRIPLRILRFKSKPKQSWGFQVRRYTSLRQELDEWAYSPRDAAGDVSRYGSLDGLMGLREHGGVELRPFIAGGVRHDDPQRSLPRGFFPTLSGGLDLKWHLSQELTLDASLLPDFGQVEADQVVLNLSNFEQYYPEKRPFFLEGVDTFTTPLQLLYTRRIGRVPPPPYVVENHPIRERLIAPPDPAPILGAAKLVGELGGGVSVGELFAVVGQRSANAVAQNGTKVNRLAEPLTVFQGGARQEADRREGRGRAHRALDQPAGGQHRVSYRRAGPWPKALSALPRRLRGDHRRALLPRRVRAWARWPMALARRRLHGPRAGDWHAHQGGPRAHVRRWHGDQIGRRRPRGAGACGQRGRRARHRPIHL